MLSFSPSPKLKSLLAEPKRPFIHRDLSWLQFNSRVLAEARLKTNPALERIKFLAITSSNLDEFFMIRMASLSRSISAQIRKADKNKIRRLIRIRSGLLDSVADFIDQQAGTLHDLANELRSLAIHLVLDPKENDETFVLGKKVFDEYILPELEPPAPFTPTQLPLLDNIQLGVIFKTGVWFKIPKKIRPVFSVQPVTEGPVYFFFLDHLLETHLGSAFRFDDKPLLLRLTRDADLSVDLEEEDSESIPDLVMSTLSKREKGRAVRLQCLGALTPEQTISFLKVLRMKPQQIYVMPRTLCMHGLWSALGALPAAFRERGDLVYPPLRPMIPIPFQDTRNIFESLKLRDFLFHHPYDAFDGYVNWIRAACDDPAVTTIEQTVYRMDALSPVIDALKAAASRKKVRVVIELRARFDELNNLRLTDELRKAGVEVTFGFGKLKLHAKIALVTRTEEAGVKLYTHLSTGNYNAVTARQYTDLAILTSNADIGDDARYFFDSVWSGQVPTLFKTLVPAPSKLHRRILQLIDSEISAAKQGKTARIVGKVNTLVDEVVIANLYEASNAGVQVDLIVRGACSLVPGIKGLSENIRVVSIVDRFLEHSRLYYFENSKALYLSSADWMPRNFFSRLELAFPVLDEKIYRYIESVIIPTYLNDRAKARELTSDGVWKKRPQHENADNSLRSQFYFEELANQSYRGTPLG